MEFQQIYESMKQKFEQKTGESVADDGDLGIRMQIFANELASVSEQIELSKKQMFPQTAEGIHLDRHAAVKDITRKEASGAKGMVLFSRSSAATKDILIPEGTICCCSGAGGINYRTTEQATLKAGSKSVQVQVEAEQTGKVTNLSSGRIDTIVSGIAGIQTVSNPEALIGGAERETDEQLRKRLFISYLNPSTGGNLTYYEAFAMKFSEVWSAKAVRNANQLRLYVTDIFRSTPNSLCEKIQQELETARELNLEVIVEKPTVITQNIQATVYVNHLQNSAIQNGKAVNYLENRIYQLGIGENLNPYSLAAEIGNEVEGYREIVFKQPSTLVQVKENQILKPGVIAIELKRG